MSKNVYLAMFDILGFKAIRNQLGTDRLYGKYLNAVLPIFQNAAMPKSLTKEVEGKKVSVADPSSKRVEHLFFSDTFIFYTPDDSFDSFIKIIFSAVAFLQGGFGIKSPVRGAIGHGDFITAGNINGLMGEAVEDAYIGEQSQVWSGCMLTEKCQKFSQENKYINEYQLLLTAAANYSSGQREKESLLISSRYLKEYEVPFQKNPREKEIEYWTEKRYALDWTKKVYNGASTTAFQNPPINDHQKRIMDNTKNFETWARAID